LGGMENISLHSAGPFIDSMKAMKGMQRIINIKVIKVIK